MRKIFISMIAGVIALSQGVASAQTFGVCTHMGLGSEFTNISNIQSAEELKLSWIRDEARWNYMQSGAGSSFQLRDKDADYIKKAHEAGINQLLILAFGNTSYEGIESDAVFPKQNNSAYYNGFLDYVRYTVGKVGDYVEVYELWNEPNIENFNYNLLADGEDYAKLYLDVKAIISELDPTAKLLCGSITGANGDATTFGKQIFNYIKNQGNVNTLIDGFSIHLYTQLDDEAYAEGLSEWEEVFDSYGYTGDVWMTENGVTADNDKAGNEEDQAAMVAKLGMQWENYLKTNNREGMSFWYTLRNKTQSTAYENPFGLVDSTHNMKPAGEAMIAYNTLTGDKDFDSLQKIMTKDNWFSSDEYGYLATYKNEDSTVYIAYDSNSNRKTTNVTLSGDIAYVYDCCGNVTETIENPSGTKSITMATSPVIVECITYISTIDDLEYDKENAIVTVSGECNIGDSVTIELIKDGVVKGSKKVKVDEECYTGWFSVKSAGAYTIRVGKPEFTVKGKTSGWAEEDIYMDGVSVKPAIASETKVSYDAATREITVSGKINDYVENQEVVILAVPRALDVNNMETAAIGYMRQISAEDGEFYHTFKVPEYFTTNASVYIGATGVNFGTEKNAQIGEGKYIYVADIAIAKGDALTATATVRNFTETDKKASVVIAQYDTNGRLINMTVEEKTVLSKTYEPIQVSLSNVLKESGAYKAKAFIWSDLTELVPLSEISETDM